LAKGGINVPSGKTLVLSFLISILSGLFIFPGLACGMNDDDCFLSLSNDFLPASEAFTSVTDIFAQMNICLAAEDFTDGYYLIKAQAPQELQANLQEAGISPSLSTRIIAEYLLWKPELKRLVLIPTDSIPILTEEHREQTECLLLNNNIIIFRLRFFDCYLPGDQYSLFVTGIQNEGRWVIHEWQWINETTQLHR